MVHYEDASASERTCRRGHRDAHQNDGCASGSLREPCDFLQRPHVIRDPRFHNRSSTVGPAVEARECFMPCAEGDEECKLGHRPVMARFSNQRESRRACCRCPRALTWPWMAFAPVLANCFFVACALRAEALAASWRPAARTAASRPASSCCRDIVRTEAFLLIAMCHLLAVQLTSGDLGHDAPSSQEADEICHGGRRHDRRRGPPQHVQPEAIDVLAHDRPVVPDEHDEDHQGRGEQAV
jgi:hypothetical protein